MDDDEVEVDRRSDTTWNRPTQRFGSRHPLGGGHIDDPLGLYKENIDPLCDQNNTRTSGNPRPRPHSLEEIALSTLDLNWPVTVKKLKSQYKKLVKIHHPDANQGDKLAEERFKKISEAYSNLLRYLEQEKVKTL
ncbi:MAG: DnaJ domain-containing protein [Alphaproteobacteria bacterium]|nr:DnaJ domain-containing protein [Rhodospirillales bacterium]MCW9045251.1 DnaJ domain-containing protein [Alphaproteobacteria bacterium]